MSKILQIKLVKVEYQGDSIGDDILIEVEHPKGLWSFNKKIKNKTTVKLDKIIYQNDIFENKFQVPLNIKVIEKDLVFNDFATLDIKIDIDSSSLEPKITTYDLIVGELRSLVIGKRKGKFSLTLETLVFENIYYVPLTDDGWFVCLDSKLNKISIPSYLKIHFDKIISNKEYFTVLEGQLKGKQFYVSEIRDKQYKFLKENPQTDAINLVYSISKKTLKLNGKVYNTTDYRGFPWTKGLYDIEIADYPHHGGLNYENSKYATVWFRIGHSGDRYLHTGSISAGCMTVTEVEKWDEIFKILISARKGDGQSVGVLEVID